MPQVQAVLHGLFLKLCLRVFQVHEIKFDEFGIMEDQFDEATADQLKKPTPNGAAGGSSPSKEPDGAVGGAAAEVIDEDLFDDEDLDELEEDLGNLDV